MHDFSVKILSDITIFNKYAKYIPELNRRETWEELCTRNMDMHIKKYPQLEEEIRAVYKDFVIAKKVLPSMRSMQFAGKPIELSPNRLYNCCYVAVDDCRVFSEVMFLLLGGTGVGYSVQKHHVAKLPSVTHPTKTRRFVVSDSIEGWADAVKALVGAYFLNKALPKFDFSDIRPKGAALITSGGKAPGPEPLKDCLHNLQKIFDRKKNGDQLTTLEVHDSICYIADAVLAGGIRRAALIALFSIDDEEMLTCKFGNWYELNPHRARANNSAVVLRHKVKKEDFDNLWQKIKASGSGEPGILFSNNAEFGTNPCFSGDTLVAVADGRNAVSIKQLAEEGKDVPVYSIDPLGKVSIKTGRHPRITGYNQKLLRIHLDDDTYLDTTPEHNFLTLDGEKIQAKDLVPGTSLPRFSKRQEEIVKNGNHYYRVRCDVHNPRKDQIYEHRLIAQFNQPDEWEKTYNQAKQSGWMKGGLVVHHKDYNSLNNTPENLEIMTFQEHTELHAKTDTQGEKNGRFSDFSHEQIKEHALVLTKKLGRKFSSNEWTEYAKINNLPQAFSTFRKNAIGTLGDLAKWAAVELKLEFVDLDPRTVRTYQDMISQGYQTRILDGDVLVTKTCEACHQTFEIDHMRREVAFCSIKCSSKTIWTKSENRNNIILGIKEASKKRTIELKKNQARIFSELKFNLKREPLKKEWEAECKKQKCAFRLRTTFGFQSYEELKAAGNNYNHKVLKIEELPGEHTVYNITVDDNHTVGIITDNDSNHFSGIFITQCGEISLKNTQFCNLTEINLSNIESQEDLNQRAKAAAFLGTLQAGYTDFHYLRDSWKKTTEKDALLGVSGTGIASGAYLKCNLTEAANVVATENARVSKLIGINKAARQTSVKPSGTTSLVLGTSSGIHAWFNDYYIRRMKLGKNEAIYKYLIKEMPELIEDDFFKPHLDAFVKIPVAAPPGSVIAREESAIQLLERVKHFSINWITPGHFKGDNSHNVSATVYIKENEWETVGEWMWNNKEYYNGLSVLPFDGGTYTQAPHESITKEKYEELLQYVKDIDLTKIVEYKDETAVSNEVACAGGACEINF